ncbi:MAG: TlpA family protein disulfide reductase [Nitrospirae bacterium]|nr:TlpA family protein disulfide reductase [Nitrospirota bacterium]
MLKYNMIFKVRKLIILTVLCVFVLSFSSVAQSSPWDIDALVGTFAPDFTLQDLKGNKVSLIDFRGKVVLLNFWATWCPPCREEIPSLNKLMSQYQDKGLVIIGVSSDSSYKRLKAFARKYKINFIVLHDATITVTRKYKVFSLPTTFLINKRGRIVQKFIGAYDWTSAEVIDLIKKHM